MLASRIASKHIHPSTLESPPPGAISTPQDSLENSKQAEALARFCTRAANLDIGALGPWREVQCWVDIEEVGRLQLKTDHLHRHDRPVLRSGDVCDAKAVMHHHVFLVNVAILPFRDACK